MTALAPRSAAWREFSMASTVVIAEVWQMTGMRPSTWSMPTSKMCQRPRVPMDEKSILSASKCRSTSPTKEELFGL